MRHTVDLKNPSIEKMEEMRRLHEETMKKAKASVKKIIEARHKQDIKNKNHPKNS